MGSEDFGIFGLPEHRIPVFMFWLGRWTLRSSPRLMPNTKRCPESIAVDFSRSLNQRYVPVLLQWLPWPYPYCGLNHEEMGFEFFICAQITQLLRGRRSRDWQRLKQ